MYIQTLRWRVLQNVAGGGQALNGLNEDTLIGKVFGNYRIVRKIGEGGMGAVYLAQHPEIKRKVAVKVLGAHLTQQIGFAERFVTEAKAIAQIEHPNIIEIFDFGRTEQGQSYYVMELLKGKELRALFDTLVPMTPENVVPFLEQIGAGLQAAHDKGIVHRDLKPANIFVLDRPQLTLKILDFGLVKQIKKNRDQNQLTTTGQILGSPITMSPEQAGGDVDNVGPQSDIYSLGIMLYWFLSGNPPFKDEHAAVVMSMHLKDKPPPLLEKAPDVPADVAAVVERCLEKKPQDRFDSVDDLVTAFVKTAYGKDYVSDTLPKGPHQALLMMEKVRSLVATDEEDEEDLDQFEPDTAEFKKESAPPVSEEAAIDGTVAFDSKSPSSTTLQGSASSFSRFRSRKKSRVPLAIGIGTAAIGAAVALFFVLRPGNETDLKHRSLATPPKTVVAKKTPTPKQTVVPPKTIIKHAIKIVTNDELAICKAKVGGKEIEPTGPPCQYAIKENTELLVQVTKDGFASFEKKWKVTQAEILQVEVLKGEKRIILAGDKSTHKPAATVALSGNKRKHARKTTKKATRVKKPTAKTSKSKLPSDSQTKTKKAKPKRDIGRGTMDF